MGDYKWFKQMVSSTNSDPALAIAEEKFGPAGYAMVGKLRELLAAQTPFGCGLPSCTVTPKGLSKALGCRGPRLQSFLNLLLKSGEIQIHDQDEFIHIQWPNFQKLLDNQAVSSSKRISRGRPYRERMDLPDGDITDERLEDKQEPLGDSSDFFWKKANLILSGKGLTVLEQLPSCFENHLKKYGPDKELKNKLIKNISKRFSKSETSSTLGGDIISQLENVYDVVESSQRRQKKAEERATKEKAELEKRKNSPERNDPRCIRILEEFSSGSRNDISKDDIVYLTACMSKYWGEDLARSKRSSLFDYRDRFDSIRAQQLEIKKRKDLEKRSDDDDDDPTPSQVPRTKSGESLQ